MQRIAVGSGLSATLAILRWHIISCFY